MIEEVSAFVAIMILITRNIFRERKRIAEESVQK